MLSDKEIEGAVAADVAVMTQPKILAVVKLKMMEFGGELPSDAQLIDTIKALMWMKHKMRPPNEKRN